MSRNQSTQRCGLVRTKKGEGCYDAGCIEGDFDYHGFGKLCEIREFDPMSVPFTLPRTGDVTADIGLS